MTNKDFKTVEEQLNLLRSRGLTIRDEDKAKDFLLRNNYYRISGYSLTLRKNNIFSKSATFQNIIDIYNFDHELRHIILQYLEVKEILDKVSQQKTQRLPHEAYLKHFVNDLEQDVPLWAYVDLFTISDISFLYTISEQSIRNSVAHTFGLTMNKGASILGGYMHSMTIIRNLCAHGSRLYNRLFEQKPSLNKSEKALLIKNSNGELDNAHFYGFLLIMKRLLPADKFNEMKDSIITLTKKYPFVKMDYYGFRNDWQQKL